MASHPASPTSHNLQVVLRIRTTLSGSGSYLEVRIRILNTKNGFIFYGKICFCFFNFLFRICFVKIQITKTLIFNKYLFIFCCRTFFCSIRIRPKDSDPDPQRCLQVTYLDPGTGRKHPRAAVPRRSYGSFSEPGVPFRRVCLLHNSPEADTSYVR